MAFLELDRVTKRFGAVTAVDQVSLEINRGEFLTLLGPSGCGKTTILRMVAGFEMATEGNILLDGEDITGQAANKRPMGMVFQSYALFPHMTAEQNIAFGLSIRRTPNKIINKRCAELLELVGLTGMERRYPHQLSGGQQQRVALARALAVEPKVLLLDEPLSALDAKVRVTLRTEIRRIQQQLKMTAIYVTHDQEEALAISDRIAVMAKGKIEQLDAPEEIYSNPSSVFAATFVGTSNQMHASVQSASEKLCRVGEYTFRVATLPNLHDKDQVLLLFRPEKLSLSLPEASAEQAGSDNRLEGVIELRTFMGPFTRFHIKTMGETMLMADVHSQQARGYAVAQHVQLIIPPDACQVLPLNRSGEEMERLAEAEVL